MDPLHLDRQALERLHRLVFAAQQLPALPRLRPVVVGRPHPKRQMRRWAPVGLAKVRGCRYLLGCSTATTDDASADSRTTGNRGVVPG